MLVANILKEAGKPTETSKLVKMLAEKLNITTTHAYRLVKKAWENKEIRKVVLPDRHVLCALPQWPISKKKGTLSFEDAFLHRCFKELDRIIVCNLHINSVEAYFDLRSFIWTLPSQIKDKVRPIIKKTDEALRNCPDEIVKFKRAGHNIEKTVDKTRERRMIAFQSVEELVDKVSTFLHEEFGKETF